MSKLRWLDNCQLNCFIILISKCLRSHLVFTEKMRKCHCHLLAFRTACSRLDGEVFMRIFPLPMLLIINLLNLNFSRRQTEFYWETAMRKWSCLPTSVLWTEEFLAVPLSITRTSPLLPVLQWGLGFFNVIMHPKSVFTTIFMHIFIPLNPNDLH